MLKTWGLVISTASPAHIFLRENEFRTNSLRSTFDLSQPSIDLLFAISTTRIQPKQSELFSKAIVSTIPDIRWRFFFQRGGGDDVFFFDDKINPVERWKILEDWINENSKGANDAFNIELVVHCRALFEHRFATPLPLEATANYRNLLTSCSTVSFEQFFLLSIRTIRRIDFLNLLAPKFSYSIEKYIDTRNKNILRVINTCSRSFDRGIRNDSSSHSRTEIYSIRYRTKLISFLSFSSPIKNYTPWFR